MIIKYVNKRGKVKTIEIDPKHQAIDVITGDRNFAQVDITDNRNRMMNTVIGVHCTQVAFLGTKEKLTRRVYRKKFRD